MKRHILVETAWVFAALCLISLPLHAASVHGTVTFVGTSGEHAPGDGTYNAQFRFRVTPSTCDNDTTTKERWILVRSGRMDGAFAHNNANFRNAYNTAMTAFLSGKPVQIDGVPNCSNDKVQIINLWSSGIAIHN